MSRRRGSATALKASEVVAARGMNGQYIPIWEYVKDYFSRDFSAPLLVQRPQGRSMDVPKGSRLQTYRDIRIGLSCAFL